MADFVPPYTTKSYGEPPFPPPLPKDVWDDWLRANPQYAAQTMSTTDPATHHFGQTSTGNYEADLARMKKDLADMFKDLVVMITDPLGNILANILLNLEKSVLASRCVFACFLYL